MLYNTIMFGGWAYLLGLLVLEFVNHKEDPLSAFKTVYSLVQLPLLVFQTAAVLEIFHAAFGIVRSPVFTTAAQVASRLLVVYGALEIGHTPSRESWFFVQMLVAWCLSELIRYSFYALNILAGRPPSALAWLRYSAFLVLYPMGISGEILVLYQAIPFVQETKSWTVTLPNTMNVSFDWALMIWVILIGVYPLGSKVLYSYMLNQRRKVLGGVGKRKTD